MQRRGGEAEVLDVFEGEDALFVGVEPFVEDLVAADLVGPDLFGDAVEVLPLGVNIDPLFFSVVVPGLLLGFPHAVGAAFGELGDGGIELGGFEKMQIHKFLPHTGQLLEELKVLGEGNAREVGPQEFGVLFPVGGGIADGVDVGQDILRRWALAEILCDHYTK